MDSTTGGVLGILGFLISGGGAIYAAINHKKIRFNCCGKDIDMSVDIDETKTKVKTKPKKKSSSKDESESKKDEESPPEQSPDETETETEEEVVVVPVKKPIKKFVPPPPMLPPIRGQRSSKVANYDS